MCQNIAILAKHSKSRTITICKHHVVFVYWEFQVAYFFPDQLERLAMILSRQVSAPDLEEKATAEIGMGAVSWRMPTTDFYQLATLVLTAANRLNQMKLPKAETAVSHTVPQRPQLNRSRFSVN